VRRIVVSRVDPLGPLVLALPAVAAIRESYPDAWLGLLVQPTTAPLARLVEGVDQVLEMPVASDRLASELREFRADLLVSMSPGGVVPWAATTARIPHRVGSSRRVFSPLFERRADLRPQGGRELHETEQALALAHRAGARGSAARFPIVLPEGAAALCREWLEEHRLSAPFVVLRSECCGGCPSWPAGHFIRLATLLAAEGCRVAFSVGPGDQATSSALDAADTKVRRMPRFTGDLPTLAAFVRSAALVVGNSTGAVHLASALGAPTLVLHAPWRSCGPSRWGPYAANGWSLVADAPGADRFSAKERARGGADLMGTISPAAVLSCALAILEGREPRI